MYHYSVPSPQTYSQAYTPVYPPNWPHYYEYNTSATTSPSSSPAPYGPMYTALPFDTRTNKKHSRSASHNPVKISGLFHQAAGYPSATYSTRQPDCTPPPAKEFVSYKDKARQNSKSAGRGASGDYNVSYSQGGNTVPRRHASAQSRKQRINVDSSDEAEDSPHYTYIKPRTGPKQEKYAKLKANQRAFHDQVPAEADDSPKTRPRRASESRPTTSSRTPTNKSPTKKTAPPKREATTADAAKHHIPKGYALKYWDPTEAPIMLLGSVFDGNSLGKWIYDWTVFRHGPVKPITDIAGDLWLLLIKLAGKMKRAEECLPRIRYKDDRETVDDFLEAGDRLWARLKELLEACEAYMLEVAAKELAKSGKTSATLTMGKNSGCAFVETLFGKDRNLDATESLMQRIILWDRRFDKNCEGIVRRP